MGYISNGIVEADQTSQRSVGQPLIYPLQVYSEFSFTQANPIAFWRMRRWLFDRRMEKVPARKILVRVNDGTARHSHKSAIDAISYFMDRLKRDCFLSEVRILSIPTVSENAI